MEWHIFGILTLFVFIIGYVIGRVIGKLMNGSKKTLIDHYEERYKYLKENK